MLGIVARHADAWNSFGSVAEIRQRQELLDAHCDRIGRDPGEIVRSLYYWIARAEDDPWSSLDAFEDLVGRYREAGIEEFVVDRPRDDQEDVLEKVAAELPRLREVTSASR
jgi:hypothetical protein